MLVALDWGPLLDPPTGVGRYTRELSQALEAQGIDLVRFAIAWGGSPNLDDVRRWRAPARAVQTAWRRFGGPRIERLVGRVDCVHATNFVLPPSAVPGVVTVHDLSFEHPDAFPGADRLRELVPWSVRSAAGVIAPSAAVRDEILDRYAIEPDKVFAIPEGVAGHLFGATSLGDETLALMGVRKPFALALGTRAPRKNLARLIDAWERIGLEDWTLVIAGGPGWGAPIETKKGVVLLGRIEEETLPGLLAAADVFCYPSLYEGFGLPPLEAMAAGTAVVAGDYPAAQEVLGDSAVLVDPSDVEAIADGILMLATNEAQRRSYGIAGRARAAAYTWEATAQATIRAYRVVTGAGSSPS